MTPRRRHRPLPRRDPTPPPAPDAAYDTLGCAEDVASARLRRSFTGQRHDVRVTKKIPVAWIYLTAWMTKDQTVHFRNDIYAQDEQLLEATAEEHAFFNKAVDHPLTTHMAH